MNFKIPAYFFNKKDILLKSSLICLVSVLFIVIYNPFNAHSWDNVSTWDMLTGGLGYVLLTWFPVLLLSNYFQYKISKDRLLGITTVLIFIFFEIIIISCIVTIEEIIVKYPDVTFVELFLENIYYVACTFVLAYLFLIVTLIVKNAPIQSKKGTDILIPFSDENDNYKFSLMKKDIVYIKSSDNYIEIFCIKNRELKPELLRNNLKNLEPFLNKYDIIRCHRSYMINTGRISNIIKSGKNYEIELKAPEKVSLIASLNFFNKLSKYID